MAIWSLEDLVWVYYLPEDPDTCQLTVDGVDVTSDDFAPAYLLTLDSTGSARMSNPILERGDRIDSISFANNGDMLVEVHVGFNNGLHAYGFWNITPSGR